jgi:CheY-like chemotaxis protein
MRPKVLLVDDEPDTLKTYSDILDAEGYDVTTASEGEEALSLIDGYQPDVILLDILLPGQNGIEVARAPHLRLVKKSERCSAPLTIPN